MAKGDIGVKGTPGETPIGEIIRFDPQNSLQRIGPSVFAPFTISLFIPFCQDSFYLTPIQTISGKIHIEEESFR